MNHFMLGTVPQNHILEYMKLKIRVNKDLIFILLNIYIHSQGIPEELLDRLILATANYIIVGNFNSRHRSLNKVLENRNGASLFEWMQNIEVTLLNENI